MGRSIDNRGRARSGSSRGTHNWPSAGAHRGDEPDLLQVYTDVFKGKTSGLSAGFALTLVAETTSGALLSAEAVGAGGVLPEEVGTQAAEALLQQVRRVRREGLGVRLRVRVRVRR